MKKQLKKIKNFTFSCSCSYKFLFFSFTLLLISKASNYINRKMSLGLVAYGSSDEDSKNSDVDEQNCITSSESSNQQNKLLFSQSNINKTPDSDTAAAGTAGLGNVCDGSIHHRGTPDTGTASIRSGSEEINDNGSVINVHSSSDLAATASGLSASQRGCESASTSASILDSQQSNNRIDDISDEEDFVSSTTPGQFPSSSISGQISDEEDVGPGPAKFSILAGLPAPKNPQTEDVDISFFTATTRPRTANTIQKTQGPESSASLLSGLPAPKPNSATTLSGYEEEEEVEEEYKKKPVKAEVPVPKKRQPVKITVPSLAELDSDDEEDGPKKKKPRPAGGGVSGLLSMLPTPKQIVVKEKGRALIPHTLTKRPAPKLSAAKPRPTVTPSTSTQARKLPGVPDQADSDSDDDGESVNFFTFGGDEPSSTASTSTDFSDVVRTNPRIHPPVSMKTVSFSGATPDSTSRPSSMAMFLSQMETKEKTVSSSMDITTSNNLTGLRGPYSSGAGESSDVSQSATGSYYIEGYAQEPEAAAGYKGQSLNKQYDNSGLYQPSVDQMEQMTGDEQFQRMVGKKFRGEAMHIVDVNADDQMCKDDLTKHLTEEVAGFSYSKKKNKDMPSSVQKRKHQITYLAFQAKERELELKNQWAQNRQTKRQTQSKYGF